MWIIQPDAQRFADIGIDTQSFLDGNIVVGGGHIVGDERKHAALYTLLRKQAADQEAVFSFGIEKPDQRPDRVSDALDAILDSGGIRHGVESLLQDSPIVLHASQRIGVLQYV